MQEALKKQGYKADPPWTKHKKEFIYPYGGFEYIVCLQHIENFAKILEVEFMDQMPDIEIHEPNIREVIKQLGLEPIDSAEFIKKIDKYIKDNK